MPTSWIQPNSQNSLMDTFAQAEQLKAQRAQNALYAAKAAELPYERERAEALNTANIDKVGAQTRQAESATRKTDAEIAMDTVAFVDRDPTNRPAVIGAMRFAAQTMPGIMPIVEKLEATQDPMEFASLASKFSMTTKERLDQQLNEQKFTEQQKQSAIDNTFQQGNLDVAQGGLAQRIHHDTVMENKPQAGFSMSYDAEGRPVMSYGVKSEETALGTARGQQRAKAEENLPKMEDLSAATIRQVDEVLAHPGFESSVGATMRPYASRVHGTKESDFDNRLKQLQGGAFLQAIEQLKGSGQITEVEGTKATQAITRMDAATSEAEFQAAAEDYKSVIANARDRARAAAAGRPELPPSEPATAGRPQPQKEFDAMPMPGEYAGKRIKAPDGGVYRSNGSQWMRE